MSFSGVSITTKLKDLYPHEVPNKYLVKENQKYHKEDYDILKKSMAEESSGNHSRTFTGFDTKFSIDEDYLIDKDDDCSEDDADVKDIPNVLGRSCFKRWFSKIRGGSLRGSTFALASVTFGGGCLAFPQALAYSGLLIGIIIFIFAAGLSYMTIRYLIDIGIERKVMDYNELVHLAVGNKWRIFADINNIILCLGVVMAYQFGIYDFLSNLLPREFNLDYDSNKLYIVLICMVCIQIPLGLLKNISILQYASILATISLIYTILVIVVQSPFYYKEYMADNPNFKIGLVPPNGIGWNWLNTVGTFLFGFCNHNGVFQVFMEMDRPNKRRSVKVTNRSIVLEVVLYLSISLGGFFSLFYDCGSTFITRENLKSFPNDYFMDIAKWALIICLNCVMAINYNIMRLSITSLVFNGKHPSWIVDFGITVLTYVASNVIVFYTKNVTTILGFIGGVSTVVISFICPILIDIKLGKNTKTHWKNLMNYFILALITLVGIGSTAKAVYDFINQG